MQVLMCAALAAGIGFSGGASQRTQVNAAAALWRIGLQVRATGDFHTADEDSVSSVITELQGFGSGFMVSPDGYLMTADHVGSPVDIVRDACVELKKKHAVAIARSMRLEYLLRDIVGNDVVGRIEVLPTSTAGDICADPKAITWKHDDIFPFRIVAREPAADLALLKLDVQDVAFIPTDAPALQPHAELYALGFVELDQFTKATGFFVWSCEEVSEIEQSDGTIDPNKYRFMRMMVPVKEGMSGGPVMAGSALAGVTVVHSTFSGQASKPDGTTEEVEEEGGYAVPGAYVHAWYLWASGRSSVKPQPCQDPHSEADVPSDVRKPRR